MALRKFVPGIVALAMIVAAPALAGGTPEQRDACMPDAMRLCTAAIPDEARVENCLRSAGPQLSAPCHAVFFPAAATPTTRGQLVRVPQNARGPAAGADDND